MVPTGLPRPPINRSPRNDSVLIKQFVAGEGFLNDGFQKRFYGLLALAVVFGLI